MDEYLFTPRGYRVKRKNLGRNNRVECQHCHLAVYEEEYFPCPKCDSRLCSYCHESGCPNCERIEKMKTQKRRIRLEIMPNSHRLIILFAGKVKVFCSAKANVTHEAVIIAGIKIAYFSWERDVKSYTFNITTADAARLLNRLARPAYDAQLDFAIPRLAAKWETRIEFIAEDF